MRAKKKTKNTEACAKINQTLHEGACLAEEVADAVKAAVALDAPLGTNAAADAGRVDPSADSANGAATKEAGHKTWQTGEGPVKAAGAALVSRAAEVTRLVHLSDVADRA